MTDPVDAVLAQLKQVKKSGDGWVALCPAHEDSRPSLSIKRGTDGRVLLNCHRGCDPSAVASAIGMEVRDLFSDSHQRNGNGASPLDIVAEYSYTDESGALLYQSVRLLPKDFRQRRPDDRGGWVWSVKGVRRVPYRLPEVLKAVREDLTIFVVEGEKDADRLAELRIAATTNVSGAGKWGEDLCGYFTGARVVILPDNDAKGREHAQDVAAKLSKVCREVRVLELDGLPEKGDVSDWLNAGGDELDLLEMALYAPVWTPDAGAEKAKPTATRKLPAPMGIAELLKLEEPAVQWIAEGLIPTDANILLAAYPKSFKTFTCLDLAVSAVMGGMFLGKFKIPRCYNVGMILMEGSRYQTRKRIERICQGHGVEVSEMEGGFFFWHRPPLKLTNAEVMNDLAAYVNEKSLDLLIIDNWSYVSTGNSNDSDDVTPQLDALSRLRQSKPGLSSLLVHHARKASRQNDSSGERLTDIIRNSTAFGAWYDVGFELVRQSEASATVTVRPEMRDYVGVPPFAFKVEDEFPADLDAGRMFSSGYLRLLASDRAPAVILAEDAVERLKPALADFLKANQGCSKERLRQGIQGANPSIVAAFDALCRDGFARYQEPASRGAGGRCWLNYDYPSRRFIPRETTPAPTSPNGQAGYASDPAHPRRGEVGEGENGLGSTSPPPPHGVGGGERVPAYTRTSAREASLFDERSRKDLD